MTTTVVNTQDLLKLKVVAARKQREYAEKRYAYTEVCLREFRQYQENLRATRVRLFRVIKLRPVRFARDNPEVALVVATTLGEWPDVVHGEFGMG
jgi:hypothetical protein